MTKLIGGLVVFAIVAALLLGVNLARLAAQQSPDVRAALAEQEQAKAAQLRAEADYTRQLAEQARLETEAKRQALPAVAAAKRWYALGGAIAFAVLVVGLAWAVVTYARTRAQCVYPDMRGQWPILIERRWDGVLLIADTSRNLSPVMQIDREGNVTALIEPAEVSALQLATQAQASGAMVAIARGSEQSAGDVIESVSRAAKALPAPTFANAGGDGLRFVYVKQAGEANTEAARDLADVREFITGAKVRGLARRAWLGVRFASGHECTRTRYDELIRTCERAGVLCRDGQSWKLAVSEAEALDAFGVGEKDISGAPE
jgi:hypothetical protein